jgi:acyl-CoA synthetase (AMP-forming)/AMP-acid ligase II
LRAIHNALEGLNEGDSGVPLPEVNDYDPALLLYTSGTTARPKGVTQTHRTLLESVKLRCSAAPDSLQTVLVMTTALTRDAFLPTIVVENIIREVIIHKLFESAPIQFYSHPISWFSCPGVFRLPDRNGISWVSKLILPGLLLE